MVGLTVQPQSPGIFTYFIHRGDLIISTSTIRLSLQNESLTRIAQVHQVLQRLLCALHCIADDNLPRIFVSSLRYCTSALHNFLSIYDSRKLDCNDERKGVPSRLWRQLALSTEAILRCVRLLLCPDLIECISGEYCFLSFNPERPHRYIDYPIYSDVWARSTMGRWRCVPTQCGLRVASEGFRENL